MSSRWMVLGGVLCLGLQATELCAQSLSFDLRSSGGDAGYVGNCIHLEGECVNLTVSAWSYDTHRSPGVFAEAALGQWATGLGVLNRDELRHRSPYDHQVDSVGEADYVLFFFDHPVQLLNLTVDPYGVWDSDVMYWAGLTDSYPDLRGASFGDLAAAGYHPTIDAGTPSDNPRTLVFPDHGFVNALLVGVPYGSAAPDRDRDKFKIQQLTVACTAPEPSSLGLLLLGAGAMIARRYRQASSR